MIIEIRARIIDGKPFFEPKPMRGASQRTKQRQREACDFLNKKGGD
jgi:hypothetical protein